MKRPYTIILGLFFFINPLVLAQDTGLEELSIEELLDVEVVSAAQVATKISKAPSVIRVITADEIKRRGYSSVGEALRSVPGLYVSYDYINFGVNIRGVSSGMRGWSRTVRVMIDGQPVSFRYNDMNFLGEELIPIDAVKRIEVTIGPGTALEGRDAFLGSVNIVTRTGDNVDGIFISAFGGSENAKDQSFGGAFVAGKRFGGFEFLMAGSMLNADRSGLTVPELSPEYDFYDTLETEDDLSKPMSFFGNLSYRNDKLGSFSLCGNLQYFDNSAEFVDWGALTHNNRISMQNYAVRFEWKNEFAKIVSAKANFAYSAGAPRADDRLDYGSEIHYEKRDMGFDAIDIGFQAGATPIENLDIGVGFDYTQDNYNIETISSIFKRDFGLNSENDSLLLCGEFGDTTFTRTGVYAEVGYRLLSKINISQGVAYNNHSIYGDFTGWRSGLVFDFFDQGHVKLLFGSSFNTPVPAQLFTVPIYSGDAFGNPDIEPEKTSNFDIEFTPLNTEDFSISLDFFYNTVDNRIDYISKGGVIRAENLGDVDIIGSEGAMRWSYKGFTTQWTVSYQQTEEREDDSKNDYAKDFEPVDEISFAYPRVLSFSSVNYTATPLRLNFNFEQRYIGERNATYTNIMLNGGKLYKLPAYLLFNFTLSTVRLKLIPLGETRLWIALKNITDEKYVEPGHNGIDIPGKGRSIYLGVSQSF